MALKGMSLTLKVVVTVVVILIVAFVLLEIFSRTTGEAGGIISKWITDVAGLDVTQFFGAGTTQTCSAVGGSCQTGTVCPEGTASQGKLDCGLGCLCCK